MNFFEELFAEGIIRYVWERIVIDFFFLRIRYICLKPFYPDVTLASLREKKSSKKVEAMNNSCFSAAILIIVLFFLIHAINILFF